MKNQSYSARIVLTLTLLFALIVSASSQEVAIDLGMAYKIRQEGQRNSDIDTLSYIMTDLAGPRLTGSPGFDRAAEIARKKLTEYGLSEVRIEKAADFPRGGWDYSKAYAAMTKPYYNNFAVTPVAWTSGTRGLVKGEVVLVDIKKVEDIDQYRGKLKGKIILNPPSSPYEVSFEPLATRLTDEQLRQIAMAPTGDSPHRRMMADYRAMRELHTKISEFLRTEGVMMIINSGNAFNIPRSTGNAYDGGEKPVTEINVPLEVAGRMERLIRHGEKVEVEAEIKAEFTPGKSIYNVIAEIPGTDPLLKDQVVLLGTEAPAALITARDA
jgi:carboxypeptidase Q